MRIVVGALLGLAIAVGLLFALHAYTHVAVDLATRWSQQVPPPAITLRQRLFLKSANFIASFLVPGIPLVLVTFVVLGGVVAARSGRGAPHATGRP